MNTFEIIMLVAIAISVLCCVILGVLLLQQRGRPEAEPGLHPAIESRLNTFELEMAQVRQAVLDDLERSRGQYAKARAAESRARRKAESEEYEGEGEEGQGILPLDVPGSREEQLRAMHESMESVPGYKRVAQALARQIAGIPDDAN